MEISDIYVGKILYCKDLLNVLNIERKPVVVVEVYEQTKTLSVLFITSNGNVWDYDKYELEVFDIKGFKLRPSFAVLNIFDIVCDDCNDSKFVATPRLLSRLRELGINV